MARSRAIQSSPVVGRARRSIVSLGGGVGQLFGNQPGFVSLISRRRNVVNVSSDTARFGDIRVEDISPESILTTHIKDANITTAKINDLAVTTAKINNLAVTDAKINDLSATKINTGTLDAGLVTISSDDGKMTLTGNILQIKDAADVIQLTIGKYDGTNYGMAIGSDVNDPDVVINASGVTIKDQILDWPSGARIIMRNATDTVNTLIGYSTNQFEIVGDATNGVKLRGGTIEVEGQDLVLDTGAATLGAQIRDGGRVTFYNPSDTDAIYFQENASSELILQGTAEILNMTRDGMMTLPLQPAFLAENSASDANVTGDGTVVTVEFDTEIFDQNSDFNTTTDTFTAPKTGRYLFCVTVSFVDAETANAEDIIIDLITSNRTYRAKARGSDTNLEGAFEETLSITIIADMDISDTARVDAVSSGGASATVDIEGTGSQVLTRFSGCLLA